MFLAPALSLLLSNAAVSKYSSYIRLFMNLGYKTTSGLRIGLDNSIPQTPKCGLQLQTSAHFPIQTSSRLLVRFPTLAKPFALYAPPSTASKNTSNLPMARCKACTSLIFSTTCHCGPVNVLLSPLTLTFPYTGSGLPVGTFSKSINAASAFVLVLRPCLRIRVVRREVAVLGMRGLTAARMALDEVFAERADDQVEMWFCSA